MVKSKIVANLYGSISFQQIFSTNFSSQHFLVLMSIFIEYLQRIDFVEL